jgi:hypothetical protein
VDDVNLNALLATGGTRQYWLKPIGLPGRPIERGELNTDPELEIPFPTDPAAMQQGDVLIGHRTGHAKMIFVAERLPGGPFPTSEAFRPDVRERFPWSFRVKNLTLQYGGIWPKYNLRTFALAREYNDDRPTKSPVRLGAIQYGAGMLRLPQEFAEWLIVKIRDCDSQAVSQSKP